MEMSSINLLEMHCSEPEPDQFPMTDVEIGYYAQYITGWRLIENEGEKGLGKRFPFADFAQGHAFTDRIAALAEEENHHPAIFLAWGRVIISWRTHKVGGLHLNDFIMAAKTDEVYRELSDKKR